MSRRSLPPGPSGTTPPMPPPTHPEHLPELSRLAALLLGGAGPSVGWQLRAQVAGCRFCAEELEQLEEMVELLTAVPAEVALDGPPDCAEELVRGALQAIRSLPTARGAALNPAGAVRGPAEGARAAAVEDTGLADERHLRFTRRPN